MQTLLRALFSECPKAKGQISLWKKGKPSVYFPLTQTQQLEEYRDRSDWYFSCTLQDPDKWNKKNTLRRANIKGATCITHLWLDIDLNNKGDKYPTPEEVQKTFDDFPLGPSILVHSGRGIHAYWLLDKAYKPDKNLCKQWQALFIGYLEKVNPARTLDSSGDLARVLRLPGTIHSGANKVVRALSASAEKPIRYSLAQIRAHLAALKPKKSTELSVLESMGALDTHQSKPISIKTVAQGCKQISELLNTGGAEALEPLWYASLGIAAYTKEKEEAARQLSYKHPKYDENQTAIKLTQWLNATDGPTTCARFQELSKETCKGCEHLGIITTPIQLGAKQKIYVPELEASGLEQKWEIPQPFCIGDDGKLKVLLNIANEGEQHTYAVIYDHKILPINRTWDEQTSQEFVTFKAYLPKDGWRNCEFPAATIADRSGLLAIFARAGVIIQPDLYTWFIRYIVASVNQMQAIVPAIVACAQMGWQDNDNFAFAESQFTKTGIIPGHTSPFLRGIIENLTTAGTKEGWIDAFDRLRIAEFKHHQFAAFTGFAVPLMKALDFPGIIYNLYSSKSGTFKSFFLKVIMSIYGKPIDNLVVTRDSEKARFKLISGRRDLPTTLDEITDMKPEALGALCYSISQGRFHHRLEQDSTLRDNRQTWRTILVTSSNKSLHAALFNKSDVAFGEAMRVLEVNVADGITFTKSSAWAANLMKAFTANHGVIGREWLEYVVKNKARLFQQTAQTYELINSEVGVGAQERYWVSTISLILVAAEHTKQLGFHNVDINFIREYGLKLLSELRTNVLKERRLQSNALAVLQTYIAENVAQNAYVQGGGNLTYREPRGEVKLRVNGLSQYVYVQIRSFSHFCANKGLDFQSIVKELKRKKICCDTGTYRMGLGLYSNIRLRCLKINLEKLGKDQVENLMERPYNAEDLEKLVDMEKPKKEGR